MDEIYEEPQQDSPLYTLDDYEQIPASPKEVSPILQGISSLATGKLSVGPVDSSNLLNETYRQVAEQNQNTNRILAEKAAGEGDIDRVGMIIQDMHNRNNELNAQIENRVARMREVATAAFENIAFTNLGVSYNNTPEQIAIATENMANNVTVAAVMEEYEKKYGGFARSAGTVLQGLTPLVVGRPSALGGEAERLAPGKGSKIFWGDSLRALKDVYKDLGSEAERVDFIRTMQKNLENTWSMTGEDAFSVVKQIVQDEEESMASNVFNTAEPVIGVLPVVSAVAKSAKMLSAANKLAKANKVINSESAIANAGGKSILIDSAVSSLRQQAISGVVKEVTGIQTIQDIGKLTGIAASKLLPDAITTASGKVQKQILKNVDDTVKSLKQTIGIKNIRDDELNFALKEIERTYDKAIDPSIHLVTIGRLEDDPLSTIATILRGTKNGEMFLTKEAAEEYIKLVDPSGKRGFTLVQDKANNTYRFSEQTKKAMILERDAKQAKLLELQSKQGEVVSAKTGADAKLPKDLAGAKPNYAIGANKFSLQFDNDIDKSAFIISQTKKSKRDADYVQWLKNTTGWSGAEIDAHGERVRNAIRSLANTSSPGNLKIPSEVQKTDLWKTQAVSDNTEEISKLESSIGLLEDRLKAAKDIENGLSAGWLIEEKVKKTIDISSLGKFKEEDIQSMMRFAAGDLALGASKEVYEGRLIGVMAESRYRELLTNMVSPVSKLNKQDRITLNNVLVLGDKQGKVFNSVELRGQGLISDEGQTAYFAVRAARDISWSLKNDAAAKSFNLKGWRQIWHPALKEYESELDGFKLFGKETARNDVLNKNAFDPNTKESIRLTGSKLAELEARGFKVIEFDTPVPLGGVERKRIVVNANGLEINEIKQVIPYRTGEFSRMYNDEYFVRLNGKKLVDDVEEDVSLTHRTAKNVSDANKYAKAYNEMVDLFKAGTLDEKAAAKMQAYGWEPAELIDHISKNRNLYAKVNYTRTQDDYLDALNSYSRNFTSKRGEHIKDVEGNETNIADPLDALAAEIGNTAYMASHTEWLDVNIKRWHETAKGILPSEYSNLTPEQAFSRYMRTKGTYVGQDQTERFVRRVADQIAEGMKVNDKESRTVLGVMRTITEGIDTLSDGKFETVGIKMRQADYVSWAKTYSFHAVFGFNPVQLLVQGLNAANAIIVSPTHGLKAARSYSFYRAALTSDNVEVWKNIAKVNKWASLGFGSEDEFVRTMQMINRSGIIANLNTSSLYGMELGKYSLTKGFLSRISKASSFFFREGEEASRIVSFDIARREWIAANPGKIWDSNEALREILVRQDILTGTMTNANAAWWQKGVASIPMQFMQFPVKFALNIANGIMGGGRTLTRGEALKLLGGNFLLFGSAGLLGTTLAQSIFGENIEELDEETRLGLSQGLISYAVNAVSSSFDEEGKGVKLAIGDRFNPLNTYTDMVKGLFSAQDPGIFETLTGAFGGAMTRTGKAFSNITDLYLYDDEMSTEKLGETVKMLSMISSVGNNYFQGEMAENLWNQKVSRGIGQYRFEDKELFFQKYLGIKPATATDFYSQMEGKSEYDKRMKKEAERLTDLRIKALEAYNRGDDSTGKMYTNMVRVFRTSHKIGDLNNIEKSAKQLGIFTRQEELKIEYLMSQPITSQKMTFQITN